MIARTTSLDQHSNAHVNIEVCADLLQSPPLRDSLRGLLTDALRFVIAFHFILKHCV